MKYGWLKDIERFLILLVIVFCVFRFLIGFSMVKGESMEPTLQNGELVMYVRIGQTYEIGDVVSVRIPSGEYYVKRVIATEGDTVDIRDGKVYVNGEKLDEPYTDQETDEQEGSVRYPLTIEENQVFVMGDNRKASMDSRSFGVIGERQIKGRLLLHAGKYYIRSVQ